MFLSVATENLRARSTHELVPNARQPVPFRAALAKWCSTGAKYAGALPRRLCTKVHFALAHSVPGWLRTRVSDG